MHLLTHKLPMPACCCLSCCTPPHLHQQVPHVCHEGLQELGKLLLAGLHEQVDVGAHRGLHAIQHALALRVAWQGGAGSRVEHQRRKHSNEARFVVPSCESSTGSA